MDAVAAPSTILASSTSTIPAYTACETYSSFTNFVSSLKYGFSNSFSNFSFHDCSIATSMELFLRRRVYSLKLLSCCFSIRTVFAVFSAWREGRAIKRALYLRK